MPAMAAQPVTTPAPVHMAQQIGDTRRSSDATCASSPPTQQTVRCYFPWFLCGCPSIKARALELKPTLRVQEAAAWGCGSATESASAPAPQAVRSCLHTRASSALKGLRLPQHGEVRAVACWTAGGAGGRRRRGRGRQAPAPQGYQQELRTARAREAGRGDQQSAPPGAWRGRGAHRAESACLDAALARSTAHVGLSK